MMNLDMFIGILIADGSLTGDKKQPCISIKMRDYSIDLLQNIAKAFGGTVNGPYSAGKSSMARGAICTYMLRGPALLTMVSMLDAVWIPSDHFNAKYEQWKERYCLA